MTKTTFQQTLETAERLRLADVDPELQVMAKTVANTPGSLGEKIRSLFTSKVEALVALKQANGFFPPPQSIANGEFRLGTVAGIPFCLTAAELLRHLLVAGPSGSGKTTFLLLLILQLIAVGVRLLIPDYKADLLWLACHHKDFVYVHANAPINILEHGDYVSRPDYIHLLTTCLCRSAWGGEHLRQAIHECLVEVYRRYDHPNIEDLISVARERITPKSTYQYRDAINGLIMRLSRLHMQYPGLRTRVGIPHNTLFAHSVYLASITQTDMDEFLTAWLVYNYYYYARHHQHRNHLDAFVLLDEGLLSFGTANRIDGPVLLPLIPVLRELGCAIGLSTAHLDHTHETIRANAYTTIVLPLANATDLQAASKTLGLTPEEAPYLLRLQPGQGIIRSGKWRSPLLLEFDHIAYDKTVNPDDLQELINRTNALAPNTPPVTDIRTEPRLSPASQQPVSLSVNAEQLLQYVGERVVTLVTEAYTALKLHPQAGHRARRLLEQYGYLQAEQITVRRGRGGTGTALSLTPAGYDRLGKRPRSTRGGDGAQHRWLVMKLCQAFGVEPDIIVGKKPVDILIPYNNKHQEKLDGIINSSQPLTTLPTITDGQLLGIEIEANDPQKTAENNALKNHEAGITITIIAVIKDVQGTINHLQNMLPAPVQDHTLVIDALELVEQLHNDKTIAREEV